jgi:hypothetical protein
MLYRVTQDYRRTVEYDGTRTAEVEADSIQEARQMVAAGDVEWEWDDNESPSTVDNYLTFDDPEFEKD